MQTLTMMVQELQQSMLQMAPALPKMRPLPPPLSLVIPTLEDPQCDEDAKPYSPISLGLVVEPSYFHRSLPFTE